MNNGYIKLYRQILDNPVVCKDSDHFAVWVYLLLNATHDNIDMLFNGKRITLKPGQLLTSRKSISEQLGINQSKCERIFILLKNEQMIEQQTSSKNRLITILNWVDYQTSEQQIEQQLNNKRTTSEQQVNTNKNVKNVKNDKNEEYIGAFETFSNGQDELKKTLQEFEQMRIKAKKPMTEKAKTLLVGKLEKLGNTTEERIDLLNQSILNNWADVYPIKDKQNKYGKQRVETVTNYDTPTSTLTEQEEHAIRESLRNINA